MKKPQKTDEEKAETLRRAEEVRDISVEVYKRRLEDSQAGAVDRMLAKDEHDGSKLRSRAASYDALTRAYMAVLSQRNLGDVPDQPQQGIQHN